MTLDICSLYDIGVWSTHQKACRKSLSEKSEMHEQPPIDVRKRVKHYDNGEAHFLTFSCHQRLPLLSKDRTRRWLIEALERSRDLHGFQLWAWVIMPEHVHLLLCPPQRIETTPESLKPSGINKGRVRGILSSIKRPVARQAIDYLAKHGPAYLQKLQVICGDETQYRFWQAGSGFDKNVSETRALHEIVHYIHMNPVRRGLVDRPEEWLWSSARDWLGIPGSPITVDRTIPSLIDVPWTKRQ